MTVTVFIADDQAMVRQGFRALLDAEPDLEVVGEAANGEEAVTRCRELAPDVVLMDVRMPVMDGVEATRRLQAFDDQGEQLWSVRARGATSLSHVPEYLLSDDAEAGRLTRWE